MRAVERWSRPWVSETKDSVRSPIHLTGRPTRRAAQATRACSRYGKIFMPKPPPTSGDTTRIADASTPRIWQSTSRTPCGPWVETCRV